MEQKNSNQFISLIFNIVIPVLILTKLSDKYFGPVWGLVIALSFPLFYGLYDLIIQKQKNFISVLGFVGILLTGIIGVLEIPPHWIAVKEAAIPFIIGVVVLVSTKTEWQLIKKFLYNKELLDIDQIEERVSSKNLQDKFTKLLNRANIYFSFSFFFSSVLNYALAKIIVQSMPGTSEFNAEVGRMTALSFPVIALPSVIIMMLILWYLLRSLKKLTELTTNEIFSEKLKNK